VTQKLRLRLPVLPLIAIAAATAALAAPDVDPKDGGAAERSANIRPSNIRPSDPIAGRTHWAFAPLVRPEIPAVAATDWPRSPIDGFVLSRLEAQGLRPAPDADRRVLARRIHVALAGLPPTAAQLHAFALDPRADAVEQLVDELLGSRQFAERWGRHWLDLARYADSNGLDENFLLREAWRYRNWVIDAIERDVPFDRFLVEQIAGDLLPYDSIEARDRQRIAAGFLVVGPKVLLGNDAENQRLEIADEQIDTIGRTVLGLTLGCARCHDHKFDPVPTADYYGLAGILTSTQVMEQRHMLGEQRVMERLVGLGADGDALDSAYETYWRERPALEARAKRAKTALELLERGDASELAKQVGDGLAERAADESLTAGERIAAQKAHLDALAAAVAKPPEIPPRAMIPCDAGAPSDEHVRLAGRFDRRGDQVPRGFLRVLDDAPAAIPAGASGRLELARWLTDVEHGAGRLTARVFANRVWQHLIGQGIVRTVDNFGRTGEAPSHPELLDWLASELIASRWSLRHLVREIARSRTFAMASRHDGAATTVDPGNRLLWRAHRRRLEPEAFRDAMLLAAGTLELEPVGSTVSYLGDQATAVGANTNRRRTDFSCRSVYLPVIRNDLPELFAVFDFADPHRTTGLRPETMVATQGLFILNDESVIAAADATARRLLAGGGGLAGSGGLESGGGLETRVLVERLFALVLGSPPSDAERDDIARFVETTRMRLATDDDAGARERAWSLACHALFASSRFQIVE